MKKESLILARDILLGVALAGGVVTIAFVAPGLVTLIGPVSKLYSRRSLETAQVKKRLRKLADDGFILWSETKNGTRLELTKQGKRRVLEYRLEEMKIPEQKPWDGRYRFVMFDIPETKKVARNVFRSKLVELGFKKVQQSIWCHKFPCKDEIEYLANLYEIGRYINLVEGDRTL